jgi:hypothetical protein
LSTTRGMPVPTGPGWPVPAHRRGRRE